MRVRDIRDPRRLGEALLALRAKAPKREKASETYDRNHAALLLTEPFDDAGGIQKEQEAKYRAEFPDGLPSENDIDPGGA